jgi:hypothetical protein
MKRHMKNCIKKQEQPVICAHCGTMWSNRAAMVKHASHCVSTWPTKKK